LVPRKEDLIDGLVRGSRTIAVEQDEGATLNTRTRILRCKSRGTEERNLKKRQSHEEENYMDLLQGREGIGNKKGGEKEEKKYLIRKSKEGLVYWRGRPGKFQGRRTMGRKTMVDWLAFGGILKTKKSGPTRGFIGERKESRAPSAICFRGKSHTISSFRETHVTLPSL